MIPPSRTPPASRPDPLCEQSYANDPPRGGQRLRFGIGPNVAGEAGSGQVTPLVPDNRAKRDAALTRLKGRRSPTVRLNRLFEADGERGIRRFQAMARDDRRLGIDVELQVRYHPIASRNGDIHAWVRFVRRVVRAFGPMPNVTGLQIGNEVNVTISPNTSDGAFAGADRALVDGVIAAKRLSDRLGYRRLTIGFNYAWRFDPRADAAFWRALRRIGGRALRRATDWVGVDFYPGTYVPAQAQIVHMGDAFLEGIAQVRKCYTSRISACSATTIRPSPRSPPTGG